MEMMKWVKSLKSVYVPIFLGITLFFVIFSNFLLVSLEFPITSKFIFCPKGDFGQFLEVPFGVANRPETA